MVGGRTLPEFGSRLDRPRQCANITCSSSNGPIEPVDEEDPQMKADSVAMERAIVPKRRQKHYSYDEGVDERESLLPMSRSRSNARFRQKRTNPWKERKQIARRNRLYSKSNVSRVSCCLCGIHQRGLSPFGSVYAQPRVKKPLRQTIYAKAISWRSWCVGFVMSQRQTKPVCQS